MNSFFRSRPVYPSGHALCLTISYTLVRIVSSPEAATTLAFALGWISASCVAQKRLPIRTPSAPSMRAAARLRPSAIPPAATTMTSGACLLRASTTVGTNGKGQHNCPRMTLDCEVEQVRLLCDRPSDETTPHVVARDLR